MEELIGWCCVECEENFYLPNSFDTDNLVVFCPLCGGYEHTICNTTAKNFVATERKES
ncbi:hypothetical protein [Rossellomorea marisflavi]|uniref:hypothetical protein n=1 Tax=Rossellomorea marisflavi TaxID=189381 RepID=UPI001653B5FB|nr:hypothetical protein [Rossellomorea marisflavi]